MDGTPQVDDRGKLEVVERMNLVGTLLVLTPEIVEQQEAPKGEP